jgi:hypothetical protein
MGCLIVLVAFFSARFALALMFLFTNRLGDAFDSTLGPLLGFFFLPWTTLMYALLWGSHHSVAGFEWFLVAFAFLIDIASWAGEAARERSRVQT